MRLSSDEHKETRQKVIDGITILLTDRLSIPKTAHGRTVPFTYPCPKALYFTALYLAKEHDWKMTIIDKEICNGLWELYQFDPIN